VIENIDQVKRRVHIKLCINDVLLSAMSCIWNFKYHNFSLKYFDIIDHNTKNFYVELNACYIFICIRKEKIHILYTDRILLYIIIVMIVQYNGYNQWKCALHHVNNQCLKLWNLFLNYFLNYKHFFQTKKSCRGCSFAFTNKTL
jgi:hypothetical protein